MGKDYGFSDEVFLNEITVVSFEIRKFLKFRDVKMVTEVQLFSEYIGVYIHLY